MSNSQADTAKLPFFADEVQLAGWQDTHNGGCKITLWLPSIESMEKFRHMTSRHGKTAGQRLYAVFVELNEQEEPVAPDTPAVSPRGKLCMEAIGYTNNSEFMRWITDGTAHPRSPAGARAAMLEHLGILSRKELDTDPLKAQAFQEMKQDFFRRPGGAYPASTR